MRVILLCVVILACNHLCYASLSNVYISQTAQGSNSGVDCSNAHAIAFFNTTGNWGTGGSQIGSDTSVHICGTLAGSSNSIVLQFKGSGTAGHPVRLFFESGAIVQAPYCNVAGCIDLNGNSYIIIDGGFVCGETAHWITTACNGTIRNTAIGSSGQTCIDGPCSTLNGSTGSTAIGTNTGSPSNIEVRNLKIGPLYVRSAGDTTDGGNGTSGVGFAGGTLAQGLIVHHMIFTGLGKAVLVSLGSMTGTLTNYQVYNSNFSDQCWALGIGANSSTLNVTGISFHDNEVSNWDSWAPANTSGNVCHTNGTMLFNGDGYTVHSGTGFIGDTASAIYNNYLHGDLSGRILGSSPSGMLSCQDNCVDVLVANNIVVDTCSGINPSRGCGGNIYFNGAGGGRQRVYNNTLVKVGGSCIVADGTAGAVLIKNNILSGCGAAVEIRPNTPSAAIADYNDGHNIGSGSWSVYNSANSGSFLSLSTWRSTYNQDIHTVTTDPKLDASYHPQSGSGAMASGVNLTSLGIAQLNTDVVGGLRPSSGAWDAGAYQFISVTAPNPPTALTAITQ
jgi:hypothetical protein